MPFPKEHFVDFNIEIQLTNPNIYIQNFAFSFNYQMQTLIFEKSILH